MEFINNLIVIIYELSVSSNNAFNVLNLVLEIYRLIIKVAKVGKSDL